MIKIVFLNTILIKINDTKLIKINSLASELNDKPFLGIPSLEGGNTIKTLIDIANILP